MTTYENPNSRLNGMLLSKMSFMQLNTAIKEINYLVMSTSRDHVLGEYMLKEINHHLVTELNIRSYEGKLYRKNLKHLGNVLESEVSLSRNHYNKIVTLSEIIFDGIFSGERDKFKELRQVL